MIDNTRATARDVDVATGGCVRLEGHTTNGLGVLYTPATVSLRVVDPLGVETFPALDNYGVGHYRADVTLPTAGAWTFYWVVNGVAGEGGTLRA
jgi:hypothetical protein